MKTNVFLIEWSRKINHFNDLKDFPTITISAGLPPNERVKKLRMDVHDNTLRLWEKAKKSRDEISGEKALPLRSQRE